MKVLLKFTGYIGLKWILFYIYQFTQGNTKWNFHKVNNEGVLLALFMLLILPCLEITILFLPFQLALKRRGWKAVFILFIAFGLELLLGWYATNRDFEMWMVVKIAFSICLFAIIYRKRLTHATIGS